MKLNYLDKTQKTQVSHNPKITKKILLGYDDINNLTQFSRATFPSGETAYKHSHEDMTEVFYIESGAGIISVNEEEISLIPGMCIAVEPNETHEIINTGNNDLIILFFGIKNT